ncbi:HAD-like protein [Myriangium duriaei CBS 260.36]|uniref:HAD-like protein n=1 Tax=Myriangium duriaei CBS 260.36 TaxID=1168546 RepID=A0A9P4MGK7_9PEZI|nr:HAD-like protein [Myriangium duriaei CBS 260.36]
MSLSFWHEHYVTTSTQLHNCSAVLVDMDGTIIDSTPAIVKFWTGLGQELGIDPVTILKTSHGRRTLDVLQILAPELANWEYVCRVEGDIPKKFGNDAVEIPGSHRFVQQLVKLGVPWAIVTSGTRPLVTGWLDVLGLAQPKVLISAEDVAAGKPDPAPYTYGMQRLGVGLSDAHDVLVLEDAPAGIRAAKSAGCRVIALATTHGVELLRDAGADWIVRDARSVNLFSQTGHLGRYTVEISDGLI